MEIESTDNALMWRVVRVWLCWNVALADEAEGRINSEGTDCEAVV